MKVLVTGASGLIGAAVCAGLRRNGHDVVRVLRRTPSRASAWNAVVLLDMSNALRPEDWAPHLNGVHAVINCAGVLQDNPAENTHTVHAASASALFAACERAGVRKVIH